MSSNNKDNSDNEFDFIESYPVNEKKAESDTVSVNSESSQEAQVEDNVDKKKAGVKHLIQCHCVLPQYKKSADPVFHQFAVFSVIDPESDTVEPKFAACNNCGAAHKVVDICKSEIITGKDEVAGQMSIEDFKYSLPNDLYNLFMSYDREICDFEHAQFILENNMWDSHIVLSREELEEYVQGKLVRFISDQRFRVESYMIRRSF